MQHLRQILEVLQEKRFVANKKKCVLGDTQVEYLGHIISEKGVAVDPAKVKSVVDWPIPQSVKGVKGFLGLQDTIESLSRTMGK